MKMNPLFFRLISGVVPAPVYGCDTGQEQPVY